MKNNAVIKTESCECKSCNRDFYHLLIQENSNFKIVIDVLRMI